MFLFKKKSYDFIVEEKLPFELLGKGDAFFVYFEKQNKTTMDVINFLCKKLHISRLTLGVAGLKDKDAITRQWISIYKSALKKIGGEHVFVDTLAQVAKIVTIKYHSKPLQMTDAISNHFFIRLRASQKLSVYIKEQAKLITEHLFEEGVPNFFGSQRFGIYGKNREIGKDLVDKKTTIKDTFERKFKLQAYSSRLFNQYLKERLPLGKKPLEGEIIKNEVITGPVFGHDTQLAEATTKAGVFQQAFMKKYNIDNNFFETFKQHKIFGIPRAIRVLPTASRVRYQGDDLLIEFSLGSGSYASILIHQLLEKLDKLQEKTTNH